MRERLGAAARQDAISDFGLERMVDRYEACYRAVMAGHPVGSISGEDLERAAVKICLVIANFSARLGGAERQCQLLARTLTRQGHDVVVLTRGTTGTAGRGVY